MARQIATATITYGESNIAQSVSVVFEDSGTTWATFTDGVAQIYDPENGIGQGDPIVELRSTSLELSA
jgi:hypothetical protein